MNVILCAGLAVVLGLANIAILKILAIHAVNPGVTTFYRGCGCLIITIFWSLLFKESLRPKSFSVQAVRLIFSGVALVLIHSSYSGMHASSIALVTRMDIPFVILFGALIGYRSNPTRIFSAALTLLLILVMVSVNKSEFENRNYFYLAILGTALISVGYLFVRNTVLTESPSLLSLVPAVGSIVVGLTWATLSGGGFSISVSDLILVALSSVIMFSLYRVTRFAYRKLEVGKAEIYSVLTASLALPVEMLLTRQAYSLVYLLSFCSVVLCVILTGFVDWRLYEKQPR